MLRKWFRVVFSLACRAIFCHVTKKNDMHWVVFNIYQEMKKVKFESLKTSLVLSSLF